MSQWSHFKQIQHNLYFFFSFWWSIFPSLVHAQVKFSELTLDTFRMIQSLEWEPSGSFYRPNNRSGQNGGTGPSRSNFSQDIVDPTLPSNPRKSILYRPSVTHFLAVSMISILSIHLKPIVPFVILTYSSIDCWPWHVSESIYLGILIRNNFKYVRFTLQVLATICEEMASDGVLLIYLSAAG